MQLALSFLQALVLALRLVRSFRGQVRALLYAWVLGFAEWLAPDAHVSFYDPLNFADVLFVLAGVGGLGLAAAFWCGFLAARWTDGRALARPRGGATPLGGTPLRPRAASPSPPALPLSTRPSAPPTRLRRSLTDAPSPARRPPVVFRDEFPVGLLGKSPGKAAPSANGDYRPL